MAFTKAIVLSESELRSLFDYDLVEIYLSEVKGGDYRVEDFEDFEDWVESTFEYILEGEGVKKAIIFIDGEAHEVYNGREFVRLLRDYYKVENLSEVLSEFLDDENYDEGKRNRKLGGKRLIEHKVKRKVEKLSEKFWKK